MSDKMNYRLSSKPFFSIGVTTYNRIAMLIETINSVLNQTYTDFEIIISNDNPDRILAGDSLGIDDPRVKIINQKINLGEYYNMQYLLKSSRGKYFTWLADDDLYHPDYLMSAYKILNKYIFPPCFFTSFGTVNEKGIIKAHDSVNVDGMLLAGADFLKMYLQKQIKTIGTMGLYDRDYLMSIGGLEDVSGDGKGMFSEYVLLLETGSLDRVAYINAPLIYFRAHKESWGVTSIDAEMYRRAAKNLVIKSIEVLTGPALNDSIYIGLYSIYRLSLASYFLVLMRSGQFSIKLWMCYLCEVWEYLFPLRKSIHFLPGAAALIKAEIRTIMFAAWHGIIKKDVKNIFNRAGG